MKPMGRIKKKSLKLSIFILLIIFVITSIISIITSVVISLLIGYFDSFKQCVMFTLNTAFAIIYSKFWVLPLLIILTIAWLCRTGYLFTLKIDNTRNVIDD